MVEDRKNIETAYGLVDLFQFCECELSCFDRGTNTGLFAEYVNMFFKLKQESSNYPSSVQREDDKDVPAYGQI